MAYNHILTILKKFTLSVYPVDDTTIYGAQNA